MTTAQIGNDNPPRGSYVLWHDLTAAQLRSLTGTATVVLPIAATEQHGPHLATGTDTIIADAILQIVRGRPPQSGDFVQLPTQAVGASDHHMDFGGTLSVPALLFAKILMAYIRCLVSQGFHRVVVFNAHGGNIAPMRTALAELAVEMHAAQAVVAGLSYWELARPAWSEIGEVRGRSLTHACEFETSMVYAARPDLPRVTPPARHDFHDKVEGRCDLALPFSATTGNGAFGDPAASNSELGRSLITTAAEAFRMFLSDFATYTPSAGPSVPP